MSVRVNITISDELKKYYEAWSEKTGISQSALMSLSMYEYVDQKKALNSLGPIMEQIKLLEAKEIKPPSEIEEPIQN